jgi:hypothetical protein
MDLGMKLQPEHGWGLSHKPGEPILLRMRSWQNCA